jgi:hypothetical protein
MKTRFLFLCFATVAAHGQTVLPAPTAVSVTANPTNGQLRAPTNFFSGNAGSMVSTLSAQRWPSLVAGFNDLPVWSGASVVTDSIEIVNRNAVVTTSAPTLAFHRYGSGGPQFRLDSTGTNVLYLEGAVASGARQPNPASSSGLSRFQIAAPVKATLFIASGSNQTQAQLGPTELMPSTSPDGTTGVLDVYANTIIGARIHSENSTGATISSTNGQSAKLIQFGNAEHSSAPLLRMVRVNPNSEVTSPLIQINDAPTIGSGGAVMVAQKAGVTVLEVDSSGRLILRAANGSRWRVDVTNTGSLTTTLVP